MEFKSILSKILLIFVFITIGFSLGRQTAQQESPIDLPEQAPVPESQNGGKVVVSSVHMTFRCWECNQIEWLTKALLEDEFAAEMQAGVIEYQTVDYMKNNAFAKRYNIASSTLVVAAFGQDGQETAYNRLDEVWTKSRKPDEFKDYVREAVRSRLNDVKGGSAE